MSGGMVNYDKGRFVKISIKMTNSPGKGFDLSVMVANL